MQTIEERQGLKVACLEEIAFRNRWIGVEELKARGNLMAKNGYGQYLLALADEAR